MKNKYFSITADKSTGVLKQIKFVGDKDNMNWCAEDGNWGRLYHRKYIGWREEIVINDTMEEKDLRLVSFSESDTDIKCEYGDDELLVTVTRFFKENGNFVENYKIKNITETVVCINRDNFGIETPFNDRYPNADECMVHHCLAHIWCGHNITWVNALKMGVSDINLGLFLQKGAIDCYDQNKCWHGTRGVFVLEPENVMLKSGEEYEIEWELFWHTGTDDFLEKIKKYDNYIDIEARHFTVFENEDIEFSLETSNCTKPIITLNGEFVPCVRDKNRYSVKYRAHTLGEHKFIINAGEIETWTRFNVKSDFNTLLENRVHFIIKNQQCLDVESPLYGAFLIYDNDYDAMYFEYANPDHNACRERMNIPLLLMKYLQVKDDPEVRRAMDLYMEFVLREFYDERTGEVFNTIGKNRDQLRLYNGPGVMQMFCEMYFVTHNEKYLDRIKTLADYYYSVGGKKCYANGFSIMKIMRAFNESGRAEDAKHIFELFGTHVDNIIKNGVSYPKHEANYEQTIVTPAVSHISDYGVLSENKEFYIGEAKKHLANLERFSGMQPDCYLYEIAVRFWDDYWFGKNKIYGDTLPHHLSCLTARAYMSYSILSDDEKFKRRAEECLRNCMCLIGDDGRGYAAHIYPYKLNGIRGELFDSWSNDQDLVLYDALYFADYSDAFKI